MYPVVYRDKSGHFALGYGIEFAIVGVWRINCRGRGVEESRTGDPIAVMGGVRMWIWV